MRRSGKKSTYGINEPADHMFMFLVYAKQEAT